MATYLKRTSKLYDLTVTHTAATSDNINYSDLMCPVCRGILIEPVTLPCDHNLCLRCLKGTFKHNSLSCPMCRIRVGSWLRTATKSETLVNNNLWEFIRSNYPKEIQDRNNITINDVPHINNESDYTQNILSGGEIHCGYELQLKLAEQEMLRQRESERLVNEQYLRKLHEQETDDKQKLAQYAQDRLLARSLAKKQLLDKEKTIKYYNDCLKNTTHQASKYLVPQSGECLQNDRLQFNNNNKQLLLPASDPLQLNNHLFNLSNINIKTNSTNILSRNIDNDIRMSNNINLIATKLQPIDTRQSFCSKPSSIVRTKDCCQVTPSSSLSSTLLIPNILTLKQQTLMPKINAYIATEPSCSNSKIYGDQNEEELRVPADLLSNNKKNIAMEICVMTTGSSVPNAGITTMPSDDKQQRVSAQSAGSHDSINPEIHHFKPIKILPRTPLKVMPDGRQIDPKILRVIPVLKRISNPVFRTPSIGHFRRIGCTWSAFKGRIRQEARVINTSPTWKSPSSSTEQNQTQSKPTSQSQVSVELNSPKNNHPTSEATVEINKNYPANNRMINGTSSPSSPTPATSTSSTCFTAKTNKKPADKSAKTKSKSHKNGALKRNKNIANDSQANDTSSITTPAVLSSDCQQKLINPSFIDSESQAMENIAERIKRRKVYFDATSNKDDNNDDHNDDDDDDDDDDDVDSKAKSKTRKSSRKLISNKTIAENSTDKKIVKCKKSTRKCAKRPRVSKIKEKDSSNDSRDKLTLDDDNNKVTFTRKRTTRSSVRNFKFIRNDSTDNDNDNNNDNDNDNNNKINGVNGSNDDEADKSDLVNERVVIEEEKISRTLLQEKQDYELARRLQAEFNKMELGISRRTRGSKRASNCPDDLIALSAAGVGKKYKRANGKLSLANVNSTTTRATSATTPAISSNIKSRRKRD